MSNRKMIYLDDAIEALKNAILSWSYMPEWRDEKIKNALAEVPSAQPEVTEEAVKDYCRKRCLTILTNDYFHELTSAQPMRKKGRWMEITAGDCSGYDPVLAGYDDPVVGYVCSVCGEGHEKEVMGEVLWNYCPFCGADMREGGEDADADND